ncbi:hypothetical protein Ccrd_023797 [Cynara cardunculus var. scolymus]|uniref:Uncharacterized protein n=1 Tax=Cynara cardunculus var. scolymus TaxID=59895 RepID=A0A118JY01_CYNCS|nr:hypothetical protein Ccrd_023797 [Cynara cardunculus var. scolymus]
MLERVLSMRRGAHMEDEGDEHQGDESKTKKHLSIAIRITNYFTRTGYLCPIILIAIAILLISSFFVRSHDLLCVSSISSFDRLSRSRFFGLDGLESDFGSLGVPWCRSKHGKTVQWTSKDLLQGLEEFVPIYETRPIKNNMYGMGFDHSFGLWFIARWLKPDIMIESGAFKGHSTWVLRQAMPNTRIISLTPRHPEKYLKKGPAYVDGNCTYFAGKDFIDFGSVDWRTVMKKHGVTDLRGGHSCFEDSDEARVRSRRKSFWEKAVDTRELCGPGEAWWGVRGYMRDDFNHTNKPISLAQHFQNSRFVESILDVYWELPPVAGPSLTHQTRYDPARAPSPIVEDGRFGLFQRLGLSRLETSVFNGYTQMVYLQISAKES